MGTPGVTWTDDKFFLTSDSLYSMMLLEMYPISGHIPYACSSSGLRLLSPTVIIDKTSSNDLILSPNLNSPQIVLTKYFPSIGLKFLRQSRIILFFSNIDPDPDVFTIFQRIS